MDTLAETVTPDPIFCIELTNGMESLKELYYVNGRGSIFSYKPTKNVLLVTFVLAILSSLFYLLSFFNQVAWIVLFSLTLVVIIFCLLLFSVRAKKYFQWKKGVSKYLKELSKYEKQYLNLSTDSFELIIDDETVIEKWKNIGKASMCPTHITLNSESGSLYLFPAKSMDASAYKTLMEFIREKMNDSSIDYSHT